MDESFSSQLLKKCNAIWHKIGDLLKKESDREPVYDNKYIKTKIKIYNNKINTNFQGNKIPEDNECCACLFVILSDSIINVDEKLYPQIFLEECKYVIKKKKIINSINEELNLDEPEDESDDDKSKESNESGKD